MSADVGAAQTSSSRGPRRIVIVARGEISADGSAGLQAEIHRALADPEVKALTVDLADVSFMDSYGLRLLITTRRVLDARGGALILQRPGAVVRRLISLTGLDRLFDLVEDPGLPADQQRRRADAHDRATAAHEQATVDEEATASFFELHREPDKAAEHRGAAERHGQAAATEHDRDPARRRP